MKRGTHREDQCQQGSPVRTAAEGGSEIKGKERVQDRKGSPARQAEAKTVQRSKEQDRDAGRSRLDRYTKTGYCVLLVKVT